MARSAKIYDFTIQPNGSFTLLVEGSFYRIQESTGALEVRRDGGSGIGPIYSGQGEREEEFKRLTLVDKTGAINKGFIVISDGSFVDDRVTGSVEVIDGGKSRTLVDLSMMAYGSSTAGANIAHVQLWNPVGSTRNLVVGQVVTAAAAGSIPNVQFNNAPLTNLLVNGPKSKKSGIVNSVAEVRTQSNPAYLGLGILTLLVPNKEFRFNEPIVVLPGRGLIITQNTAAQDVAVSFEFYEDPIL